MHCKQSGLQDVDLIDHIWLNHAPAVEHTCVSASLCTHTQGDWGSRRGEPRQCLVSSAVPLPGHQMGSQQRKQMCCRLSHASLKLLTQMSGILLKVHAAHKHAVAAHCWSCGRLAGVTHVEKEMRGSLIRDSNTSSRLFAESFLLSFTPCMVRSRGM